MATLYNPPPKEPDPVSYTTSVNLSERVLALEIKLQFMESRIRKMDDERAWLTRLVIGLIISTVIGAVVIKNNVS